MRNFIICVLVILGFSLIGAFVFYELENRPVDKNSKANVEITIPEGMTTTRIARMLKEKNLIRSELFFKILIKFNKTPLKAADYLLSKHMSTTEIIDILGKNSTYNPDAINLTFKEGERITDYAEIVGKETNNPAADFLAISKDKTYLLELISKYWFLTEEILDTSIYYPLEGYLAPNTYQFKDKNVTSKEIIEKMLDQTESELSSYKNEIEENEDYTFHQLLTLASMAQLEGTDEQSMKMIVGVFMNRLDNQMNLGSDVTTYYGLQVPMDRDLSTEEFEAPNAYNTRASSMVGLPASPICNPDMVALRSALEPTASDYLFFVADKNGKVYYTKTSEEHLKKVQEIKDNGDWIW